MPGYPDFIISRGYACDNDQITKSNKKDSSTLLLDEKDNRSIIGETSFPG
jgi:hypothetical protein